MPCRQGGAVIIVVLSLMTVLVFLGLFFYNWTNQELANATYHADTNPLEIDPDPIFDAVLRQAIIGPRPSEAQSALAGAHYSLLASILGRPVPDSTNDRLVYQPFPYNGAGATIIADDSDGDGIPDNPAAFGIDYDGDGASDRNQTNFIVNFSRAAHPGGIPALANDFQPNAGYTYPDLNSMFLAFDEEVPDENTGISTRVVIPSYFRPQLFAEARDADPTTFMTTLYTDTSGNRRFQVLRPHVQHEILNSSGNATGTARFLTPTVGSRSAESGDQNRLINPFPFTRDFDNDGVFNEAGVFSVNDLTGGIMYEYDGDVDRDGIRDSVLLDFGHRIINLPNGRQVVPMAMIKWVDNDALLNVNAHGNYVGLTHKTRTTNSGEPLSESNLGMSSYEVNLGLGLTADPTSTLDSDVTAQTFSRIFVQHRGMFGANPSSRSEASNMELLNLLVGRQQFQRDGSTMMTSTPILGRYGDSSNLQTFATWAQTNIRVSPLNGTGFDIPRPGFANTDDDRDVSKDPTMLVLGHPLDYLGVGDATAAAAGTNHGRERRLTALNGLRYPSYDSNWSQSQQPTTISPNPRLNAIQDEADETMVEPSLRNPRADSVFPTSEQFALLGSDADLNATGMYSSLRELASFNFKDSLQSSRIRRRFTTDSWDRLEFAHSPRPFGSNRGWEFNEWLDSSGNTFVDTVIGDEFTRAFPPQFGNPGTTPGIQVFGGKDPLRTFVRRLLLSKIEEDTTTVLDWDSLRSLGVLSQRLQINGLLTGFGSNGAPIFDRLTDHPLNISATKPAANAPEDIARRDRQQLCRDIYVLLYILGGRDDAVNYATASFPYTDEEAKQIAQFAVNLVDALDPDSVITRFEYDRDLSTGWDVDDDPYTIDASSDRGTVDGIEQQSLSINEVLFVYCEDQGSDQNRTEWDDTADRSFCYVELRNASSNTLNIDNDWQLRLEIPGQSTMELTLNTASITAGNIYTIGSAGDDHNQAGMSGMVRESYMRIRDNSGMGMGGPLVTVVPKSGTLDLDLVTGNPNSDFTLVNTASPSTKVTTLGMFFPPAVAAAVSTANSNITLKLRRRTNLDRTMPSLGNTAENQDNPWIDVDKVVIRTDAGSAGTYGGFTRFLNMQSVDTLVDNLSSQERAHPFDRWGTDKAALSQVGTAPNTVDCRNSFGQANTNASSASLWQAHFDRDFHSIGELFSIPLYGPGDLTAGISDSNGNMSGKSDLNNSGTSYAGVAGSLFLDPEQPITSTSANTGNRWYRLLEFVQVLPQNVKSIGLTGTGVTTDSGELPLMRRTPGRLNLNMIRHEPVLAGLIDDPMIDRYADFPTDNLTFDTTRNWFRELLKSRDGADPILESAATPAFLRIPGLPGSRPFRSQSHFAGLATNRVGQLLSTRKHAAQDVVSGSANPFANLHLFEARASADYNSGGGGTVDLVDYDTRQRIFSKILNNSTVRSHVYSGWIEIVFHDAHQVDAANNPDHVQIGAQADDLPTYRMFCVVDLSRLEEAFDPVTKTFDFRKFIIHRQQLP